MAGLPGDTRRPFQVVYPDAPDRGLATDGVIKGDPDPTIDREYRFRPHALVLDRNLAKRDLIKERDYLIPFPHVPANTCYRNSLFACLFNIAPFANFVRQQAKAFPNGEVGKIFRQLHAVGRSFRHGKGPLKGKNSLAGNTKALWHTLTETRGVGVGARTWLEMVSSAHGGGTHPGDAARPQDPDELYIYLMDRLSRSEMVYPLYDANAKRTFNKLFQHQFVPRVTLKCCELASGHKMKFEDSNFVQESLLRIGLSGAAGRKTVPEALVDKLYVFEEDGVRSRVCPYCHQVSKGSLFLKFSWLPEVLPLGVTYDLAWGAGGSVVDTSAHAGAAEYLDLASVRDDPAEADPDLDKEHYDCVYRLEAMVGAPYEARTGGATHYIAWVRRSDTLWEELNDIGDKVRQRSLQAIFKDRNWRPRLVFYVRDRRYIGESLDEPSEAEDEEEEEERPETPETQIDPPPPAPKKKIPRKRRPRKHGTPEPVPLPPRPSPPRNPDPDPLPPRPFPPRIPDPDPVPPRPSPPRNPDPARPFPPRIPDPEIRGGPGGTQPYKANGTGGFYKYPLIKRTKPAHKNPWDPKPANTDYRAPWDPKPANTENKTPWDHKPADMDYRTDPDPTPSILHYKYKSESDVPDDWFDTFKYGINVQRPGPIPERSSTAKPNLSITDDQRATFLALYGSRVPESYRKAIEAHRVDTTKGGYKLGNPFLDRPDSPAAPGPPKVDQAKAAADAAAAAAAEAQKKHDAEMKEKKRKEDEAHVEKVKKFLGDRRKMKRARMELNLRRATEAANKRRAEKEMALRGGGGGPSGGAKKKTKGETKDKGERKKKKAKGEKKEKKPTAGEKRLAEIQEEARKAMEIVEARQRWQEEQRVLQEIYGKSAGVQTRMPKLPARPPRVPPFPPPKARLGPPVRPADQGIHVPWSIDTAPDDPRIAESKGWSAEQFDKAFQDEGLNPPRGRQAGLELWRAIWLSHFDQDSKDYRIYNMARLQETADRLGLKVGGKGPGSKKTAVKNDYVNAFKREDQRRLWEYSQYGGPAPVKLASPSGGGEYEDADDDEGLAPSGAKRVRRYDTDDGYENDSDGPSPKKPKTSGGKKSKKPAKPTKPTIIPLPMDEVIEISSSDSGWDSDASHIGDLSDEMGITNNA